MTETYITVRYSETDRMGVVHHSRYYPWFEIARGDFTREKIGIKYSELEEKGIMMPLVETGAKYISGCTYEDEVVVTARLRKLTPAKCEFYYEVLKLPERNVITKGRTVHGFVDLNMHPVNFRKLFPEYYARMEKLVESV